MKNIIILITILFITSCKQSQDYKFSEEHKGKTAIIHKRDTCVIVSEFEDTMDRKMWYKVKRRNYKGEWNNEYFETWEIQILED